MYTVKRLTAADTEYIAQAEEFLHAWMGDRMHPRPEMKVYFEHAVCEGRPPQTFMAFDEQGVPCGMFQFLISEAWSRPDLSPWLSCVYVKEDMRGKGVCRAMMETVEGYAKEIGIKEMYLFTPHVGLYEKWGWEYFDDLKRFFGDKEMSIRLMKRKFD
ncbi:MAG: GNAT family N-acetyltransferase [Eubacteriaceae bacterium]|nr:GNAT family N-acetyltransferase [Eubacteriaceae bacterium]